MKVSKPYKSCKPSDLTQGFHEGHQANDWASSYGTFLVAPFKARVVALVKGEGVSDDTAPFKGGYGVRLQSVEDPDVSMVYWHCSSVFPVEIGDVVEQGSPVAQMGNSGFVMSNGQYVEVNIRNKPPYPGTHVHWTGGRLVNGVYEPWDMSQHIDWSIPVNYDTVTTVWSILQKIANLLTGK